MINAGDDAPDFLVRSTTDKSIWLRSMRGRPVVLHFFPNAVPPGSTALIERFGGSYAEIRSCGAEVIGVLLDNLDPTPGGPPPPKVKYPLVSDHSTQIARAYGVYRRLFNADRPISYGLSEAGIVEVVFQLDPEAKEPSREVIEWLRAREPVYGYRFTGAWLDIGDQEQLLAADNMLRRAQGLPERERYLLEP